jgi:nucleotide-binding universal stress UspA family protein
MYTAIVVPLDGSQPAENAVPAADALARLASGTLYLVRAAPPGDIAIAADYLARVAADLRARAVKVETYAVEGPAAETILAEAARRDADAIVMTTHGRTALGRWVLGSVADQVLHRTARPLVLVRADQPLVVDRPRRVLVPLDGSPLAEPALVHAQAIARTDGEILLQRVVGPATPLAMDPGGAAVWGEMVEEAYAEAQRYLEEKAAALSGAGHHVRIEAAHGSPAQRIAEYARQESVDLIVLSSHGRSGAARWLLGSVADELVRTAPAPLLLLRPLLAATDHPPPPGEVASVVDAASIQPGYTVFAHRVDDADRAGVGQFVGTVQAVVEGQGVHYVHVRGALQQTNELFIPIAAVRAVVHHQVHLRISVEDLLGEAWHLGPATARL